MKFEDFNSTLKDRKPPENISQNLLALWYDGNGQWARAHQIVQDIENKDAAWIHAYLHRKEGDEGNAGFWYRKAGKTHCKMTLEKEWETLVIHFLSLN